MAKVPLKGSERAAVPGARPLSPAEATERMEVSVIVRRRGSGEMQSRVAALAAGERSRGAMSRDEFARAGLRPPIVIGRCTDDPGRLELVGGPLPAGGWRHQVG